MGEMISSRRSSVRVSAVVLGKSGEPAKGNIEDMSGDK
jgi:hypothetical protein